MRITYKLTASEYIAAQNLHSRGNLVGFFGLVTCYLLAPMLGIFLMFGATSFSKGGFHLSSLSDELVPLLLIVMPLWINLLQRYHFQSSRISSGFCVIDFEEDHILTEIPGVSRTTIDWIAVQKYRESKKLLLVYISGPSFIVIPRRACEKGQYTELTALLRRKFQSGKK